MNVACEKCSAKYAVPDAKVKGRKVRITCKRCGAAIVVDGRSLGAGTKSAEKPAAAKATAPKPVATATPAKAEAAKPSPQPAKPAVTPKPAASSPGPKPVRPETPPTAIATAVSKPAPAKATMLGGLGAPSSGTASPKPLGAMGPKPVQRTMLGGVTAARPATPIASKAAVKQTLMGGLSPAFGAAPSPRDAKPAAPEAEREWTVAVTDEDHYEMNTDEVVQAFTQGNIDEDTFIWKEGMDDWLTPFEVPAIAAALRKSGLRPKGENPMAFDDATRVGPSPIDKKPVAPATATPKPGETHGVWKEPGDWKPMAAPGVDLSFDDVTVAMAAPQSRQLLEESRDLAAAAMAEEEDLTIQGQSPLLEQIRAEARLKEGLKTVPPPPPAAGTPYSPPAAAIPEVEPKSPSPPIAPVASPVPSPSAAPAASPVPRVASPVPGLGDSEAIPVSVEADSVDDLLGGSASSESGGDSESDESKTGARNEDSVLFSLDAIGSSGQAKPKPAPKAKSTLLGMAPPPPPRPAHVSNPDIAAGDPATDAAGLSPSSPDLGSASSPELGVGEVGAPELGGVPSELSSGQPELTAPLDGRDPLLSPPMEAAPVSDFAVPKKSGGGVWIALLLLLLLVGGGAAYAYTQGLGPFAKPVSSPTPTDTSNLAPAGQPTTDQGTATAEPATTDAPAPSGSAEGPASDEGEEPRRAGEPSKAALQDKPDKLEKNPKTDKGADDKASDEAADDKAADDKATDKAADDKASDKAADDKASDTTDGAPFDEVAARNALASAAGSAAACKKADGPTGQGRAIVTFASSGRVTSAVITGAFAGTTVGGCIARVFRGATVPAFSGGPKTVSKTFSIE